MTPSLWRGRNIVANNGNLTCDQLALKCYIMSATPASSALSIWLHLWRHSWAQTWYSPTRCMSVESTTNGPTWRMHSHFMCSTCMWNVHVSTWSPALPLRSQWCPHSLAKKRAQSGHPCYGVPPAAGSEKGPCEQLAPRGAAQQGCPLPMRRWGQYRKWYVWGGPPPHDQRYLDLVGCGVPGIGCDQYSWLFVTPEVQAFVMVSVHKSCCYLTDEDSTTSRDLSQWRGALTEHEQLLKRWQKAWVGLCFCLRVCFVSDVVQLCGLTCTMCTSFNLLCMFCFRPLVWTRADWLNSAEW